ncbi:hypothetical protein ACVWYN_002404 [Pedobacter sp. UYP24]
MKLIIKSTAPSALAILLLLVIFSSCKKSDQSTPAPPTASGAFSYKADGVLTASVDSAYAVLYGPKAARAMDVYSFKGKKEGMEFHFTPKTGAQAVGSLSGGGILLTFYDASGIEFDSQSGSFNLTSCDTLNKKIEGDFSFTGKMQAPGAGTKNITEGHLVVTKIYHQ